MGGDSSEPGFGETVGVAAIVGLSTTVLQQMWKTAPQIRSSGNLILLFTFSAQLDFKISTKLLFLEISRNYHILLERDR